MKEQDYKILSLLYREKNLTRVAEKLFMSQPALTYRIKKIEEEFGIHLTNKFGKNIEFTTEGEYLIQFSNRILHDIQNLKNSISEIKASRPQSFKLGVNNNFILYHLPNMIKDYAQAGHVLNMNVESGWSSDILQKLENNELDIAIVTGDYQWHGEKIFLKRDPITLISSHPIDFENLYKAPRINYKPRKNYKAYVELENSITKLINDWWQTQYDEQAHIIIESDQVAFCKQLVQAGVGYSIVPHSCIEKGEKFYQYHLKDEEDKYIYRKTWLFYRTSIQKNSHIYHFIEFCKSYFD
ncbi:LysR family transcriptional regulator [Staphylococcus delphini]|uniref:LysR family transcriptional regulator n=1 Tax=Staphylococcus delphini TaxID=53344 RepID=A0AAX0QXV9_9STAP|nr:LysR family transcriptional regulator [Staphylococcus delphini]PCF52721.1 LysR family transcriptional regulator [Staphylococcus delphini]PNZ96197.1 LysR family transcriptional regulator [Staphylococcus delphini]RIZ56422.1 LysR family transcriptional regulator [Staphylococcus delphini]VED61521.1 LysR family transcriptional regulator [Staphylococcus delphini]